MKKTTRTIGSRRYCLLTCYRYYVVKGHKEREESLVITLEHNSGDIEIEFTDLSTNKVTKLENPASGVYEFPLTKGEKSRLVVKAKSANGSYKIQKATKDN